MFYYSTDAARFSGEPNDFVVLTPSSYVTWEGNSVSGTFSDGDVCVSNIEAGAQELSNFALAGTVYNSYRGFNCYRIDGRVLTYVESPNGFFQGVCNSIYYCMDVSLCFSFKEKRKVINHSTGLIILR